MSFVKQYGARRTGTNLVRWLVEQNYHATVLMHVLGDKHSLPADFPRIAMEARGAPDPARAFVRAATHSAPAATTDAASSDQAGFSDSLAPALWEAWQRNEVRFVITIRHPRAWAASELRWLRMLSWSPRRPERLDAISTTLAASCEAFNRYYAGCLDFAKRLGKERAALIRVEDLTTAPEETLHASASHLSLRRRSGTFKNACGTVLPAHWDHLTPSIYPFPHPDSLPLPRRVAQIMDTVVLDKIDWSLVATLGYRRESTEMLVDRPGPRPSPAIRGFSTGRRS